MRKISNTEQGTDEGEETSSLDIPCSVFDIPASGLNL
jgi:hypothetical protein